MKCEKLGVFYVIGKICIFAFHPKYDNSVNKAKFILKGLFMQTGGADEAEGSENLIITDTQVHNVSHRDRAITWKFKGGIHQKSRQNKSDI